MDPSEIARLLGRRGGLARARRLSAARRKRIASSGGRARRASLLAARRIVETLEYADAIRSLRGAPSAVKRRKTCPGPLPGLYPPAE